MKARLPPNLLPVQYMRKQRVHIDININYTKTQLYNTFTNHFF